MDDSELDRQTGPEPFGARAITDDGFASVAVLDRLGDLLDAIFGA